MPPEKPAAPIVTDSPLHRVADGVWVATEPVGIAGMKLTSTMTVLDLGAGHLLLHSPVPMTPARRAAVEALGAATHLYAPNTFHHMWIGEWSAAFPSARVHAPSALKKKRPELRIDRVHDVDREPAFEGLIDEIHIDGFRLEESVLVHKASRMLVVADLLHNIGTPSDPWTRFYSRTMGFYDRVALSRVIQWTGFSDRFATRRSIDTLLSHSFDGLIVGHGTPLATNARDAIIAGCAWLPTTR